MAKQDPVEVIKIDGFDSREWWECTIDIGTAPIVCKRAGEKEEVIEYFTAFRNRLERDYITKNATYSMPWVNRRRRKKNATL